MPVMDLLDKMNIKIKANKVSNQKMTDNIAMASQKGRAEVSANPTPADKRCSVNLYGCPPMSATLKATFPTATKVVFLKSRGKLNGIAAVFFATVAEAEQVAQKGMVEVGRKKVRVQMGGEVSPEEKARRITEEKTRTVHLFGCPPDLTTLWNRFPNAEQMSFITPPGPSNAQAAVCFGTAAEAEQLAKQATIEIGGRQVRVSKGRVETAEEKRQRIAEDRKRTVYLSGCPPGLTKIRKMFPNAENVAQLQSGGQSTGNVFVTFGKVAEAEAVAKRGTIRIDGKRVAVKIGGAPESPQEKAQRLAEEGERSVFLKGCPPTPTENLLWKLFPNAEFVKPMWSTELGSYTGTTVVRFATVAEAEEVAEQGTIHFGGKDVLVHMGARPSPKWLQTNTATPSEVDKAPKKRKHKEPETVAHPPPDDEAPKLKKSKKTTFPETYSEPPSEPKTPKKKRTTVVSGPE